MVSAAESCRFFASLQHKMPLGRESGKKLARVRKVYKRVGWLIPRWMVQDFGQVPEESPPTPPRI